MWLTTEEFNFVNALPPGDVNAVTTCFPCLTVNMAKYQSMVAVVSMGLGSTYRIYAQYNSTATLTAGSTGNFCIGRYRISGSGGSSTPSTADLLGSYAALTTTGSSSVCAMTTTVAGAPITTAVSSTANSVVYIEIKSDDLPAGFSYVGITVSNSAQVHPLAVTYVMKPRYPQNVMLPAGT